MLDRCNQNSCFIILVRLTNQNLLRNVHIAEMLKTATWKATRVLYGTVRAGTCNYLG